MGLYYGLTRLLMRASHLSFGGYASDRMMGVAEILRGLPGNVARAYGYFAMELLGRRHQLVLTDAAVAVHLLCAALTIGLLLSSLRRLRPAGNRALLLVLLALFPLAVNCLFLLVSPRGINTTTQYSFAMLYVLAAMVLDPLPAGRLNNACRDAVALSLAFLVATNVYVANRSYLQLHMEYENTYALCSSVMARIEDTPGFDESCEVALIGSAPESAYMAKFSGRNPRGIGGYRNGYSRDRFFTYYLGMNLKFASSEEVEALRSDPRVTAMASYPYYGYVQKIDGYIVVKLGED